MDKKEKKAVIRQKTTLPFVVALLGAILMVVSLFLPYAVATGEYAEMIELYPEDILLEEMNLTAEDMRVISLMEYAHIWYTLRDEFWDPMEGILRAGLAVITGMFTLIAALAAWGRKPILIGLFTGCAVGIFELQNWFYAEESIVPSDLYECGIAHTIFPVVAIICFVGAAWMLVQKVIVKRQLKKETVVQTISETT